MLTHDAGWVAVLDAEDRYVGVLTPNTLHTALRNSVDREDGQAAVESVVTLS
jgi:osmoprotectant transport system ATP-binding protein